jgi:hypothetical protein
MKKAELTLGQQVTYWTGADYRTPLVVEVVSLEPQAARNHWGGRSDWQKSPQNVLVKRLDGPKGEFIAALRDLHAKELAAQIEQEKQDKYQRQLALADKRDLTSDWLTENNRKLRDALECRGVEVDWQSGGINVKLTLDQAKALLERVTA